MQKGRLILLEGGASRQSLKELSNKFVVHTKTLWYSEEGATRLLNRCDTRIILFS